MLEYFEQETCVNQIAMWVEFKLYENVNKNAHITYTEFLAATLEAHGNIEEERVAAAFDRLDSDDSGK